MKDIRLLELYDRLLKNEDIDIKKYAEENKINIRTAERDIKTIRNFLAKENQTELIHNSKKKKYQLSYSEDSINLTKSEILAVSKILLASRAFLKDEISLIIDKIAKQCSSEDDLELIQNLLKNEKFHYIELRHKKSFINNIWDLGQAIKNKKRMQISYKKTNGDIVKRIINPVGLMFSEFYFYLLAHIENIDKEKYFDNKDDEYPTIYRVDRIKNFKILNEKFTPTLYTNRFQEGKFRKQVQFMTGGRLRKIKFIYKGTSIEALLDKIPTAKVLEKNKDTYLISAQVFGNGIDRWILSQGKAIEVIEK
ncbi:WYL domain-containing protein [Fusobacterium animalis]|uniref:WYL domain-containing protein n=1 Tax=Fusobacterium animalis TaxID=76859 RepID=A0A2G9FMI9_9FUSO|nr:WYL domain-containing protein [Fusobacterium animalis]PIM93492.1 WYL domain-containing protein [Fusobacterium animalis]PIM94342.1 WYL domain-containing protein [Fusobacterium animalis]